MQRHSKRLFVNEHSIVLASLGKWLDLVLQVKWLSVRISLQSLIFFWLQKIKIIRKRTVNHVPTKWLSVYELSGCGFKPRYSHLDFLTSFERLR